jgi:hypothetical protein
MPYILRFCLKTISIYYCVNLQKESFSKIKVKGFEILAIGKHWRCTLLRETHFSSRECENSQNNCFLSEHKKENV